MPTSPNRQPQIVSGKETVLRVLDQPNRLKGLDVLRLVVDWETDERECLAVCLLVAKGGDLRVTPEALAEAFNHGTL